GWVMWILIPVCLVLTVLVTKWVLKPRSSVPAGVTEQYTGGNADEVVMAQNRQAEAEKPYSPPEQNVPSKPVFETVKEEQAAPQSQAAVSPAPERKAAPEEVSVAGRTAKEQRNSGLAYGFLTKAVGKLMNNPKAVAALLNNKYVVNGFMSRDSVKAATGSSAALASYLKNPKNTAQFMNKPVVQAGLNNQQLFDAVAGSKLAAALLDTPGGKALLSDPSALSDILTANPDMVGVISNPKVLGALTHNPKTAGAVGSIMP
ncbi:MAG: hypothetical protein WCK76_15165, partial [Elusimicrobiota bacterium]